MTITPFDSAIYRGLISDAALASLFSDAGEIRGLLEVEAALARAQGTLGLIPKDAAAAIDAAAKGLIVDPGTLAAGTASAGVPITALVAQLRAAAGEAGAYAHWGATSQDIMDTALIRRLKSAITLIEMRLNKLAQILMAQAKDHRRSVMAGRTRFQQAVPTSYGLKAAGWLSGLTRHQTRLRELKARLLAIQLGGAAGTLAAVGTDGARLVEALARELGLVAPALPWHTQRDNLAEFAGWLSLVSGALGKMAGDVLLMAQSEIAELRPAAGGGSSTMPQKANPIAGEVLVTLAAFNAGQLGSMHGALAQEHERGGAAWTLEWLVLPQMVMATGAGLAKAGELMEGLMIDAARMRANVEATNGLMMAEAATFALAKHMPRGEAEKLVGEACKLVTPTRHLADALAGLTKAPFDAPLDLGALRDPASYLGAADAFIDRALAEAATVFS